VLRERERERERERCCVYALYARGGDGDVDCHFESN